MISCKVDVTKPHYFQNWKMRYNVKFWAPYHYKSKKIFIINYFKILENYRPMAGFF